MQIYIIEPVSLCLWVVLEIYLAMCLPNCCRGNIITKYCKPFQENSWINEQQCVRPIPMVRAKSTGKRGQ